MKLFILITSSVISLFFHASGLSESHYYLEESHVILKFEMEENELAQYRIGMDCSKGTLSQLCNSNYITSNSFLKLNGKEVDFEFESASIKNAHVILILKSKNRFHDIKDIQISNTCFYELNPAFKNRARISFNAIEKSYMLSKNKSLISIQ